MVLSPNIQVVYGPFHFHHILLGLILMTVGGLLGLYFQLKLFVWPGSILFGLGLGCAVDEVGLILLTQNEGYFHPISYVAIIIVAIIILLLVLVQRWLEDKLRQ